MKTLLTAIVLSLLAAPAWALPYTGSAQFDWASLTFSGVGFTQEPHFYQQQATVLNVFLPPDGSFPTTFTKVDNGFSRIGAVQETVTASLPGVGTAYSISNADSLIASASISGVGFMQSSVEWSSLLRATETGPLTVSIGYTLAQTGLPSPSGLFDTNLHVLLALNAFTGKTFDHIQLVTQDGEVTRTGTLSVTQQLIAGALTSLGIRTELQVNRPIGDVQSVPLPSMLWPTALMFVGLAGLVAWRQRKAM